MVLRFEILVNTDILVFRFYVYIENIGEIFVDILINFLVNTDISVLKFYGYIKNIRDILVDILTKISIRQNTLIYKTFELNIFLFIF